MSAVYAFACHRPSIHHLRPSATVAAWHPGPAAPFRGKASSRRRFARLHPRPGRRRSVPVSPSAASRCSRCTRLSLSASGGAVPTQAGLLQANIATMSIGVNRLPSSFALLGRGFTMPAVCANACHRPSIQRGSRLGFYRSPVTAMSSSHRLFVARFRSLPGETRLSKGFCPFPPPIRQ